MCLSFHDSTCPLIGWAWLKGERLIFKNLRDNVKTFIKRKHNLLDTPVASVRSYLEGLQSSCNCGAVDVYFFLIVGFGFRCGSLFAFSCWFVGVSVCFFRFHCKLHWLHAAEDVLRAGVTLLTIMRAGARFTVSPFKWSGRVGAVLWCWRGLFVFVLLVFVFLLDPSLDILGSI